MDFDVGDAGGNDVYIADDDVGDVSIAGGDDVGDGGGIVGDVMEFYEDIVGDVGGDVCGNSLEPTPPAFPPSPALLQPTRKLYPSAPTFPPPPALQPTFKAHPSVRPSSSPSACSSRVDTSRFTPTSTSSEQALREENAYLRGLIDASRQ